MTPEVEEGAARRAAPRHPIAPMVAAACLVAAGGYLLWEALPRTDARGAFLSGPHLAPLVVSEGWLVFALVHLAQQLRLHWSARWAEPVPAADPTPDTEAVQDTEAGQNTEAGQDTGAVPNSEAEATEQPQSEPGDDVQGPRDWVAPALLLGVLVAYILLLEVLGFILASGLLVVGAARILGSRKLARDLVVAAVLTPSVYLCFTRLLDIRLPEGVLPL